MSPKDLTICMLFTWKIRSCFLGQTKTKVKSMMFIKQLFSEINIQNLHKCASKLDYRKFNTKLEGTVMYEVESALIITQGWEFSSFYRISSFLLFSSLRTHENNKKEEIHTKQKEEIHYSLSKDIRFWQIGADLIIFISANFSEKRGNPVKRGKFSSLGDDKCRFHFIHDSSFKFSIKFSVVQFRSTFVQVLYVDFWKQLLDKHHAFYFCLRLS